MPHNPKLVPKRHAMRNLIGQVPLSRFKDYRENIDVELIKYDDPVTAMEGIYDFAKATWSEDGKEASRATDEQKYSALDAMLEGKALGLGLETINLTFRIGGISRIDTHQIVRQRVGVTFSQQCTGDRMLHHNDVLMEESMSSPSLRLSVIKSTLIAKNTYAMMIDRGVSIQAARGLLPHNLETFIFVHTNLSTLLFFFSKRIDDGSQTWQMNEISKQMAIEVCSVYPQLKSTFEKKSRSFKFQSDAQADRGNTFSTALYIPNVDDDTYDWHKRDFLYDKTKEEMLLTDNLMVDSYYWGERSIPKDVYDGIAFAYDVIDDGEPRTNLQQYKLAQGVNTRWMKEVQC